MIHKEDYLFSGEKLYARRRIAEFKKDELKCLCIYFKENDGFVVSMYLDYLEVDESFDMELFNSVLSKAIINIEDIAKLIQLFDVFDKKFSHETAVLIAKELLDTKINLDEMYFSIE